MTAGEPARWLVLIGYMGAGKSTGAMALSEATGREHVDSDAVIEELAELEIPRIFATKGELWFRRMEERVIREIVARTPVGILSVGGGSIESAKTRDVLSRTANVVYLEASPDVLWKRVSGSSRPLANDEGRFTRRLRRREPLYQEAADLAVDATRPRAELIDEIVAWWQGQK